MFRWMRWKNIRLHAVLFSGRVGVCDSARAKIGELGVSHSSSFGNTNSMREPWRNQYIVDKILKFDKLRTVKLE
jgi:hypothetical protein